MMLEDKIRDTYTGRTQIHNCSQFVRHLSILVSPEILDMWGIGYTTFEQNHTNRIVGTLPGAYHQIVNWGRNLAEAANFAAEDDWSSPRDYIYCTKKCAEFPITAE